ncbi:hypothetical protein OV090_41705 [Nannocystis sp. RBIL2]|uniref:hypothetical protein n=1 Tax=Nannocystis sp. RBIL2 TaxID=2996788 RepID=UPI00227142D5|nr:hypothetical protein [Nannocystis sp. RBIL2]MCY1071332.1 hypothetical protein [Nannocystis sp. RBIL2]
MWEVAGALVVVVVAVAAMRPSTAEACSCRAPPRGQFFVGTNGETPADAPGIAWSGDALKSYMEDDPSHVTKVERHYGRSRNPVRFSLVKRGRFEFIAPEGGLRAGERYDVVVEMKWGSRTDRFETAVKVEAGPLALAEARLVLSPRRRETVDVPPQDAVSCSDEIEADVVRARVELPPTLEPYRDYLLYATIVDGEPRESPPRSACGQRRRQQPRQLRWLEYDPLFAACDREDGLAPGVHTVAVRLETPDGRTFTTPEQRFEVDCATSPVSEAPAPAPIEAPRSAEAGPPPVTHGCALSGGPRWWLVVALAVRRRRGLRGRS